LPNLQHDPPRLGQIDDARRIEYEYIAHQINREDTLINNRMTWVLQLNGFIFASMALAGKELPLLYQRYFTLALPTIAFIATFAGLLSIKAAFRQLDYLKDLWKPALYPNWPRPYGDLQSSRHGSLGAIVLLWVLLASWLIFLAYALLGK
jgi:hypothetical protein